MCGRYFPALQPYTTNVRNKADEIHRLRQQKATIKADVFEAQLAQLKKELKELKSKKSKAVDAALESVSSNVQKSGFRLSIKQNARPNRKTVYCVNDVAESYFVVKQLQFILYKIYKIKQSNRDHLVCQLRDCLKSGFPFSIVRTDVSSFYESIDRSKLIAKLDEDNLLTFSSKKFIRQILNEYGTLSGSQKGVPRGIGISAYLGEIYFREIDKNIKSLPGIVLYCRYVDDIIAVFAQSHEGTHISSYSALIAQELLMLGLQNNPTKTIEFTIGAQDLVKLEYLGYRFVLRKGKLGIWPSAAKIQKYKARINAAFKEYHAQSSLHSRKSFRSLVARIKFLTGNIRLWNSKSTALTGVFYNNPIATEISCFTLLDRRLKMLAKNTLRPALQKRLKNFTFLKGFQERSFHSFNTKELHSIVRAWKHE